MFTPPTTPKSTFSKSRLSQITFTTRGGYISLQAEAVDTISTQSRVPLLHFGFLQLDSKRLLGAGGSARVYRGKWRRQDVAVKLTYLPELTPDAVALAAREAASLEQCGPSHTDAATRGPSPKHAVVLVLHPGGVLSRPGAEQARPARAA